MDLIVSSTGEDRGICITTIIHNSIFIVFALNGVTEETRNFSSRKAAMLTGSCKEKHVTCLTWAVVESCGWRDILRFSAAFILLVFSCYSFLK